MDTSNPAEPADSLPPGESVLDPVVRVSEMIFGLLMSLTFVGAVSVAGRGSEQVHELFVAAVGCNLAWGLVDAVMHLVRTVTERGRALTLFKSVRTAQDAAAGRGFIQTEMSRAVAHFVSSDEVERIRGKIVALSSVPARPHLGGGDYLAALQIFFIVVGSTFPVVLPFLFFQDAATAKYVSRALALVMLFLGGLALGRYAGYGSLKVGLMMGALGTALVIAINALGG